MNIIVTEDSIQIQRFEPHVETIMIAYKMLKLLIFLNLKLFLP